MNIERRVKARYPLELTVRYQTLGRSNPISGVGRTLNMSSSGAMVISPDKMSEGVRLKLTIEWPSLLNGTTPLQLVTFGKVVRSSQDGFAIALEHYQFRTMKRNFVPLRREAAAADTQSGISSTDRPKKLAVSASGRDQPLGPTSLIAKPSF